VQRLQFVLSESRRDPEEVNGSRLGLLLADPATAPHGGGVLVIDDPGNRKDGAKTAHVGHQWLVRYGKTDNGWSPSPRCGPTSGFITPACGALYPGQALREGEERSGVPDQVGDRRGSGGQGQDAGVRVPRGGRRQRLRDQDGFRGELAEAGLPFVMALKPRRGTWAYGADACTPADAARAVSWNGPGDPGDWHPVTRAFRDGRTGTWYAPARPWAGGDRTASPA
jgi:hypothetical protein